MHPVKDFPYSQAIQLHRFKQALCRMAHKDSVISATRDKSFQAPHLEMPIPSISSNVFIKPSSGKYAAEDKNRMVPIPLSFS